MTVSPALRWKAAPAPNAPMSSARPRPTNVLSSPAARASWAIQGPKEALLAKALTDREKEQLNALLRRVMITLEDRYPGKRD